MNLKEYFDTNHGTGVLAAADKDGTVSQSGGKLIVSY